MSELFLKIVNMSISATWLVLAVLVLRFALKKAPKWSHVLLWGLVGFRLLCPFTLESALSLIPSSQTISPEIMLDPTPEIHTGIESVNRVVNPVLSEAFAPEPIASANPLQILIPIAAIIWCIGMAVMVLYTLLTYWRLRRRVRLAIRVKGNIYLSEAVSSPFVLGIFRPRIYLPYHMAELDRYHVIAHERTHIRRKDHWWKPLGFALLTVHWFNPLLWLAYVLLCRDIELACDEKVVGNMRPEQRANYSQALLNCSIDRRSIAACPLAFGEVGVKERVRNVLRYRKPAFWVILIAVIVCIVVAVCFLTDPVTDPGYDLIRQVTDEDGYTITSQERTPVNLVLNKEQLPEACFTRRGHTFAAYEVIPYQTYADNHLYLKHAGLDEDDPTYVRFTFAFQTDLLEKGNLLLPYQVEPNGYICNVTVNRSEVWDNQNTYDNAAYFEPASNGEGFCVLVKSNVCRNAVHHIAFMLTDMNRLTYGPQSEGDFPVTITTDNITSTGITLLFQQEESAIHGPLMVSNAFFLEEEINGQWQELPTLITPKFLDNTLDLSTLHYYTIDWTSLYGSLPDGHYRIGKPVEDGKTGESRVLYAEFSLPWTDSANSLPDAGLTIQAEDLKNTEVVLSFHPEDADADWYYLNPYRMEQRTDSGWTPMSLIPEMQYATWSGVAEPIPTNGGLVIPWEWYYGTLSPGTYRVALDVTQVKEYTPEDVITVYAEFTLPAGGIGPKSLEELAKGYSLEQAEIDGCLVMVDGDVRYNQQSWFDFVDLANHGQTANLRILQHYSPRDNEPSHTFIYDVAYDGNVFILRWCMLGGQDGIQEETYQYLRSFTGQGETEYVEYDAYERWVLTNDNRASYDEMWKSYASSQLNAIIPHQVLYSDLIWFPDHPEIPEKLTHARLVIPEGQDLVIEDTAALAKLRTLLANAEFLGYYPKTPDFGPELQITGTDGAITSMYVGMDSDMFELDGNCFDYGPGYDGYGSNNDIDLLWQILGLTEWTAPNVTKWPVELCNQYESYRETIQWAKENPPMNRMFVPLSPDWETDSLTITPAGGNAREITGAQRDKLWQDLCYAPMDKYYGPELDLQAAYTVEFTYQLWDFTCRIYPIGDDQFYITRTIDHVRYTCTSPELARAFEDALS